MNILFNEYPHNHYSANFEEYSDILHQGYAATIDSKNNATVLLFQDVEDHIDGNGLSALWLVQGKGQFFLEGKSIDLNIGDVILFDDCLEHGFSSDELCIAVNFTVTADQSLDDTIKMVQNFNIAQRKLKI